MPTARAVTNSQGNIAAGYRGLLSSKGHEDSCRVVTPPRGKPLPDPFSFRLVQGMHGNPVRYVLGDLLSVKSKYGDIASHIFESGGNLRIECYAGVCKDSKGRTYPEIRTKHERFVMIKGISYGQRVTWDPPGKADQPSHKANAELSQWV